MRIKQRGLKNLLVDPGMFTYFPHYDLGISCKSLNKEVSCDLERSSFRDRKSAFHFIFLRDCTSRQKESNLWSWQGLKIYCFTCRTTEWTKGRREGMLLPPLLLCTLLL